MTDVLKLRNGMVLGIRGTCIQATLLVQSGNAAMDLADGWAAHWVAGQGDAKVVRRALKHILEFSTQFIIDTVEAEV